MLTVNETPISQLMDYCKARKHFYQLLQVLFYQPLTEPTLAQLKEEGNLPDLQDLGQGGQFLYQFLVQANQTDLAEAREDFNQLFVGPGSILAPPWESVYRSREHLLFDKTTQQVREQYHQFGLQFIQENNEPDDHLTIEIEFMMHLNDLCMNEQDHERLAQLILKQIYFLDEHLSQWIPLFSEKIQKTANSDLYKGAGILLSDFILFDLDSLKEFEEAMTYG